MKQCLSEKVASKKWGANVIENIAEEISRTNPTLKGFDRRGLYRMMQFYETYKDNEIVSTLLSQISANFLWGWFGSSLS